MEEDSLELRILRLGTVPFADLERFQTDLAARRIAGEIPDTIIIADHPYTLTTGIRSRDDHHHIDLSELPSLGIDYHESPQRGGSTTILGPGQLTVYPVVDISKVGGIKKYMDVIETIIHSVASRLGADTEVSETFSKTYNRPYHCVWHIDERGVRHKVMAQGYQHQLVGGGSYIARGGFSVYLTPDAHKHFHMIDHCGFKLDEVPVISLSEIADREIDRSEVEAALIDAYADRFSYREINYG